MSPDFFMALAAVLTMVSGLVWWLIKTSASSGKTLVELAICKSDVAKLQTDVQKLRDAKVEHSTLIAQVMTQLAKLDKVETLAASVAALTSSVASLAASVERLERKIDARREDDRHAYLGTEPPLSADARRNARNDDRLDDLRVSGMHSRERADPNDRIGCDDGTNRRSGPVGLSWVTLRGRSAG